MTITMKTIIAFVFTIFFIISCANCITKIPSTSGYKMKQDTDFCRYPEPCNHKGEEGCMEICQIWGYSQGHFQNDQYVESEQVIAEICEGTSTFHFKERVRKYIYSYSEDEMHWSTDVSHAPEFTYSNLLPKTSHLWILSGGSCGSSLIIFSIHKDQDQMNIPFLSVERKSISSLSVNNDQVSQNNFSSDFSDKTKSEIQLFRIEWNRRYRRKSSKILKYGTLKADSIVQKEDMIEYRGVQKFKTKYEMKWREKKRIEPKIFSGDIHFPDKTDSISGHSGILIPPGREKHTLKNPKN
ncbi:hypothetical protein YC2023_024402 [Brassica napus]